MYDEAGPHAFTLIDILPYRSLLLSLLISGLSILDTLLLYA